MVYEESLELVNSGVHLASLYITSGDTSYLRSTIIDGNINGPAILVSGNESVVKMTGLRVTGGSANWPVIGGGISIVNADSVVLDRMKFIKIMQNMEAVLILELFNTSKITNSKIHSNSAQYGGGIMFWEDGEWGEIRKYSYL